MTSLVTQMVKNLPGVWETWVRSQGLEDPLEKEMAIYSNILAWEIPSTEEPGLLQSMGSQRVGHDWATNTCIIRTVYLVTVDKNPVQMKSIELSVFAQGTWRKEVVVGKIGTMGLNVLRIWYFSCHQFPFLSLIFSSPTLLQVDLKYKDMNGQY